MSKERKSLRGVLPAPITPLAADGSIRLDLYEKLITYLIDSGVHGIFAAGTTAEGALLSSDERIALFRIVKGCTTESHLRCVVVVKPDTLSVLREIDDIAAEEPDYISAVTPFYLTATQSDIIGHYVRIADHSPIPILLYNIPQNTHNPMNLETILELGDHPNIFGVKDSSGNFVQFQRGVLGPQPKEFTWIQGEDLLDCPTLQLGVRCIVTGLANAWAEPHVAMFAAAEAGDGEAMIAEQRRINALARIIPAAGGNVIGAIKTAAALQGRSTGHMRIPSMDLSKSHQKAVEEVVRGLGLA
jgi:4-hydroxy-tetrahydrodipicolinate synthase